MSVRNAVLLLSLVSLAACGTTRAPRGWLPRAADAGRDTYGGWVIVEADTGEARWETEGELIAVSADSLWVLGDSLAVAVPAALVSRVRVTGYDAQPRAVTAATAGGVVLTVTNGWFLVFTAPMWLITGTVASHAQARHPVRTATGADLAALAEFARFPQGLPPGLKLDRLRPRPRPER